MDSIRINLDGKAGGELTATITGKACLIVIDYDGESLASIEVDAQSLERWCEVVGDLAVEHGPKIVKMRESAPWEAA